MRTIWKDTIGFGLVSTPISLFPAKRREQCKFRLLHASVPGPVNYKGQAGADGKGVTPEQLVKGDEYGMGKSDLLKAEGFTRVDDQPEIAVQGLTNSRIEHRSTSENPHGRQNDHGILEAVYNSDYNSSESSDLQDDEPVFVYEWD